VPDVNNVDFGVIDNGGTATINSAVSQQPGGVSLGTNAGQSGSLEIASGGSLTVVDLNIGVEDGSVRIGQGGTGNLTIWPGGTLNSLSLMLGAASTTSTLTLGSTSAGTTTVNTGSVTLGRTTRVTGPNVNFSATGALAFQGTSTLVAEITGATHSPLKSTSSAALDGILELDFTGFSPSAANSWNLVDAATISGSFDAIVPDPAVSLGLGQTFAVRTVNGGNGRLAQLFINQQLVLNVNRNTGAVSISNPGSSGISLDGYGVQSALGSLNPNDALWSSLEEQPGATGGGWFESNATANHVAELKATGTSTLGAGQSWSLGNIFDPVTPTQFGQNVEDLVFSYTDPMSGTTGNLTTNYTGSAGINNIVLFVDPASGNVKMRNTSPFTVAIDGYTISSANGSLRFANGQWDSLDDQNAVGGSWFEAGTVSANRVSELQSAGETTMTMNGGTTFDLGELFNTALPKDLVFDFLLSTSAASTRGVVVYESIPAGVNGDYNQNGVVDAADYTIWRNHLGTAFQLQNEGGISPGVVDDADYAFWKSRFGATSGSGAGSGSAVASAVPEPGTGAVLMIGTMVALITRRVRRGQHQNGVNTTAKRPSWTQGADTTAQSILASERFLFFLWRCV
jgi:hypothetical protein